MALSTDQLQFFADQGYLALERLIDDDWLADIRRETQHLHAEMAAAVPDGVGISWEEFEDKTLPPRIRQLMNAEVVSPGLNRLLRSPHLLDIVEQLLDPEISLFHCKLLMKSAHTGTITPWHQDYAYWKREGNRPAMLNCMLAIDDSTKENGCLQVVPGSHLRDLQEHDRRQTSFGVFLPGYFDKRDDAVPVEVPAGGCIFFGPLTIHGSDANRSTRDRRACTIAYNITGNGGGREVLRTPAAAAHSE